MGQPLCIDECRAGMGSLAAPWRGLARGFLVEMTGRTGSQRTVETYGRTIRRFFASVKDPATATPWNVHQFAYGLNHRGGFPASATISLRLAAISSFYDFARRMKAIDCNPVTNVRRPAASRPQPRGLGLDEVTALLAAIPDSPSGLLDRAMVVTAVLTGLRRSELVGLRVTFDADFVQYVVRTKGGSVRRRELPEPAWHEIQKAAAAAGRAVVVGAVVFPVSEATFYARIRRYAASAGLRGVSPHTLRHTAAKLRRATGATIEDVSSLLGHQNIATTAMYLRRLEDGRDRGWTGVAQAIGLIEPDDDSGLEPSNTRVGSHTRSRPTISERQDGCANNRPATWIGGVDAPLPGRDPTPGGEPSRHRRRGSAGRRARRRGSARSRRTRTQS